MIQMVITLGLKTQLLTGKRVYTDINGNQIPNNKIVNGKQIGISKSEYNQLTHFNNID